MRLISVSRLTHHHLEARRRIIANLLIDRLPDLVSPLAKAIIER
jgi:hypothetical protein